jgi:predicted ATPase
MITNMLVNNYKGFYDEVFEFNKCNFFVGENSTGKTAIIDLIRNVYTANEPDFEKSDWQNVPFKSLISQDVTQKNAVISVCFSTEVNSQFTSRKFYQIRNKDGYPFIEKVSVELQNGMFLHIKHDIKQFKYVYHNNSSDFANLYDFKEYCKSISYKNRIKRPIEHRNLFPWEALEKILSSYNDQNEKNNHQAFELFDTVFVSNFNYTGPLRHIPEVYELQIKRDYDIEGKDLLYRYMQLIKNDKTIEKKINSFGLRSGLYDSFSYTTFSTQMPIIASTTTVQKNNIKLPLKFHGTGLSQVMPIILDLYSYQDILVSQPELHLHPRAQFELGKEIFDTVFETRNRQYFIETHSDFIIDAVREEQFLMCSAYDYLSSKNYLQSKKSKDKENSMNFSKLKVEIIQYLEEKHSLKTHHSLENTVNRSILLFNRGLPKQTYISLNFFTSNEERVYNIIVESDGSLNGDHVEVYRDFYMDYAFRGLSL